MRGILVCALMLVCSIFVYAQNPPQKVAANYQFQSHGADSSDRLPKSKAVNRVFRDTGMLYYNKPDKKIHWTVDSLRDTTFVTYADNGLSDSSGFVQLGQPSSSAADSAVINQNRAVPFGGNTLYWIDSLHNSPFRRMYSLYDTFHTVPTSVIRTVQKFYPDTAEPTGGMTFQTWLPPDYGKNYPTSGKGSNQRSGAFTFGMFQGSSADVAPDNVWCWCYNCYDGDQRADTSDGAVFFQQETNFNIFGSGLSFETHWPEIIDFNGNLHRVNSFYFPKSTGLTLWQNEVDHHQYLDVRTHLATVDIQKSGTGENLVLHGTAPHAFDGTMGITDSSGTSWGVQVEDGNMFMFYGGAGSAIGATSHWNRDGSVILNANDGGPASQGTTVIGAYDAFDSAGHCFSCILALEDSAKGFLTSRLNSAQRLVMPNLKAGVMVYDRSLGSLANFNKDGTWQLLPGGHILYNPSSGGTVLLQVAKYSAIAPTGALAALTIQFPIPTGDNDWVEMKITQAVAALSFTGGIVVSPPASASAGAYLKFVYDLSTNAWY